MKIKVFSYDEPGKLERMVNTWLGNHRDVEVVNTHFTMTEAHEEDGPRSGPYIEYAATIFYCDETAPKSE